MEFLSVMGLITMIIVFVLLLAGWGTMIEESYGERKRAIHLNEGNDEDRERIVKATRKFLMWVFMPIIWPFILLFLIVKVLVYWVSLLVNVLKDLFMGKKSAIVEDKEEVEL